MHEKKIVKSIFAVVMSVLTIIMSLPMTAMATETDTGLVQASDGTTVKVSLGNLLKYGDEINWFTHIMYADGKMAYCVNPNLPAPSGTFGSANLTEITPSNSKYQLLLKALYYGYGGDGFEESVAKFGNKSMKSYMQAKKTEHWLGASGTDLYYLLTHRVLAKIYGNGEWDYALTIDWRKSVDEIISVLEAAPNVSTTDKMYILDAKDGTQKVIVFKEVPQLGSLEITKDSSNHSLTDNNTDCYSLKGTVFTVTNTATNKKYTLTTNTKVNDGSATVKYKGVLKDIPVGEYTIKETQAGKGYALAVTTTNVTISGDKTSKVTIKNNPQSDPVAVMANKIDENGKGLAGAEFTIRFYKGYFTEEEIKSGKADSAFKRYWTIKTNSNGYAGLSSEYLVDSNNDFYYATDSGNPALPLGTVTIQETKAPNGYIKDDTLYVRQITSTGTSEGVFTYNPPTVPNEHEEGELRIVKTSEDGVVSGIKFNVYTTANVLVGTYTTDNDGLITKNIDTGTYKIEEVVSDKYNAQPIKTVTVKKNETATVSFNNTLKDGWLEVVKTAEPIKNADGTTTAGKVDGIEFELYNSENVLVGTYTTGADGTILKGGIKPGTYKVHENAPAGYRQPSDRNVEIKPNQTTTVKFHNVTSGGDLTIRKTTDFSGYLGSATESFIFKVEGLSHSFETEVEIYPNRAVTISLPKAGAYRVTEILSETQKLYWQEPEQPSQDIVVNDNEQKTVTFNNHEKYGNFKLKKTADDGFVDKVQFEFFGISYAGKSFYSTFSTDENGEYYLDTNRIPIGEYTLREVGTPSPNLYVEQQDITVKIEDGKTTQVNVHNENVTPKMQIIKTSDDGIVKDMEFKVSCEALGFEKTYKTDETGFITAENLKEGKYTIEEINAPDRYESQAPQTIEIKYPTTQEEANTPYVVNFHNTLKDGKAKIVKTSASGNVEGFEFNITGTSYKGEYIELLNLKTDSNGLIVKDLPQGTYTVEEINVPGYFVVPDPQIVTVTANETAEVSFHNDYQRGDGELLKTSDDGKVAGLKFRLYGTADCGLRVDEIAITNDDGIAEFKNILIGTYIIEEIDTPEQYKTLEPMAVTVIEGFPFEVVAHNSFRDVPAEIKKTSEYGIIEGIEFEVSCDELNFKKTFTTDSNGLIATNLYPGTYQVTELNVPEYAVPQATQILVVEPYSSTSEIASVQFDNLLKKGKLKVVKTADDGVIENVEFKIFGTSNSGAEISISTKTDVNGEAIFDNIPIGRYTLSEVGQSDRYVTVIDSDFDINWSETTTMFVNNELKKGEIRTKAKDKATDCGYAYVSKNTTLIDTVTYEGLGTNTEYTIDGVLMDKVTGEQLLINGNPVTASKTFTTTSTGAGEVVVEFNFNSTELRDKSIVVFEQLYYNGVALASHKDINDIGQTVIFKDPDIGTTAKDVFTDEHEAFVSETTTIVDTVEYINMIVGKEYTIKGILMNKTTGEALLVDGAEVTATKTFTAESENGTVDMEFTFNSSALKGTSVVAFETISYNGIEVATHCDINDEGQTVKFKDIDLNTTATDTATGGHNGYVSEITTIVDRVEYTGLIVGKEYTVTGVLMNKSTGEPLLVDGAEIISSSSFTAESEDGYIDITFTFDSSALKGKSVVAFETLTYEDVEVAVHADINDDGQTVTFKDPKVGTTAKDVFTGEHEAFVSETTTIVDTVVYSNLIVGKEYTVKGILMNKATGEALLVDGAEVTATKTFTAESENGTVDMEFTFNSSVLKGTSVVVFETLYFNDLEVATHCDINDEGQTVTFKDIDLQTIATDTATGEHNGYVSEIATIVDIVEYTGLIVGKEYTVKGILMNKATGEPLLVDDVEVTATKTFTAEATNGTIEVEFTFNSLALKGTSVVVFETLYFNDLEVAAHCDINDDGQTVIFLDPKAGTTAKDVLTGGNYSYVNETTTIVDTVAYEELIVGKEYTVKGILMNKETGEPLLIDDAEVTAEKTFTAEAKNGTVDIIFELNSTSLKGKSVVVFEHIYYNDLEVAVHADISDEGQTVTFKDPKVGTTAKDVFTGEHEAFVSETTTIVDTVEYSNMIVGKEYTIKGILMNKTTGEALLVDGAEVTATKTFTAESENGTVDMEFTFNSSALKGTSVVGFETISYNGIEVATHCDINDEGQTVKFKDTDLNTTATDTATGGHNGYVSETTTIVDRVEYTGLIVGKEYTVTGVLMNKSTGEPLLVDGAEIISSSSFTAESEDGYIDITFTFDSSALKGESVVAFETLTYEDIEVATHTDINDDGQTVTFEEPKLSTTATDKNTEAHYAYINTTTTITDVVEYSNLIVGKEYTVKGILMNKATGEALLVDGAEVTATKTFTAETSNGTVEVEFTFNSSALKGTSVVVFETLYFNDLEVATHSDITDDGQTVIFLDPKAGTTAKDLLTGDNYTYVSENTTIVDTVAYEDLLVGKEYTVKGILMNKETGEPLLIDGAEVTSEKTFTAEAKNGTVDIIFELNSTSLKGKSVVVFEHIYYNNLEVAVHADISDEGQTVTFKDPDIGTTAKDKTSGKNTAKVSKTTTIVDTVKYSNLIVGKEYTVSGVLMSKETGKPFLVDGKQVTATKTFKATTENGSVDVEFTFDSSALEGKSVVVFETLYFNNLEVAVHADINDKGQTVTFEKPDEIESSGTPDKTESTGTPDQIDSTGKPDTTESTPYTGSKVPYVLISLFISSAGVIMLSRKRENN